MKPSSLIAFGLSIALTVLAIFCPRPVQADSSFCSAWTREGALQIRDQYLKSYIESVHPNPGALIPKVFNFSGDQTTWLDFVSQCPERIEALGVQKCTANFTRLIGAHRLHTRVQDYIGPKDLAVSGVRGGYGFAKSDRDYLKSQPAQVMALPAWFKNPDPQIWRVELQKRNIPYLEFQSQIAMEEERIIYFETMGEWDRFIFADMNVLRPQLFAVIAVENKNKSNPKMYFREFVRGSNGQIQTRNSDQTCYQCHANGLRAIVPKSLSRQVLRIPSDPNEISDSEIAKFRLNLVNKKIAEFGPPNWNGELRVADFGPSFGHSAKTNCVKCHNGIDRGELNYALDWGEIVRKVQFEGSMPPTKKALSPSLREQLLTELKKEWIDNLLKWAQPNCEP